MGGERSHHCAIPAPRDEEDARKLVGCFTSGLMTNPFSLETQPIVNMATGVLPDDVADALLASHSKGKEKMMMFIHPRKPRGS